MTKYTFRTKTETFYRASLIKKGVLVEAEEELDKRYPTVFELVGAKNDGATVKAKEPEAEPEKPASENKTPDKAEEPEAAEDKEGEAKEPEAAGAEENKPTNPTVDNMKKGELLELAGVLKVEGAEKMNVGELKKACKAVLDNK